MRTLITGASSGLGQSIAMELRARGEVVTMGRRERDGIVRDLSEPCENSTYAVRQGAGPFDAIVHCAGAEVVAPLRLTTDAQYRTAMMAADSAFAILRAAAAKGVMTDGGSIVMMSSVAAQRGVAGMAAYSAGKAAIEGMVRAAAVELAPRRIRVNAVAAGAFHSPMHDRVTARMPGAATEAYARAHPLGFGSLEAVRDAVLGILSEPWTTGTVRVVDGGYLA